MKWGKIEHKVSIKSFDSVERIPLLHWLMFRVTWFLNLYMFILEVLGAMLLQGLLFSREHVVRFSFCVVNCSWLRFFSWYIFLLWMFSYYLVALLVLGFDFSVVTPFCFCCLLCLAWLVLKVSEWLLQVCFWWDSWECLYFSRRVVYSFLLIKTSYLS